MDFKERKGEIGKDEMLRVSMFDAGKMIIEGMRGLSKDADEKTKRDHFMRRTDAFFTDYSLMGLLVHQNYPKVMSNQFVQSKTVPDKQEVLDRMALACDTVSDYGLMDNMVRSGDMHWELLTGTAALSVKIGHHAGGPNGGFLPGFPEFPGWLGKNSSKSKHERLLGEMQHHTNKTLQVSRGGGVH